MSKILPFAKNLELHLFYIFIQEFLCVSISIQEFWCVSTAPNGSLSFPWF